jgi:hypothetical protein
MRNYYFLLVAAITVLLTGCAGRSGLLNTVATDQALYEEYVSECTFKDGQTAAPKWICGYPIYDYAITEVGYSEAGSETEARARALIKLAGRIQTAVESEITLNSQGDNSRSDENFNEKSRQIINERLSNTRVLIRSVDPSTRGLHVLVVADERLFNKSLQGAALDR